MSATCDINNFLAAASRIESEIRQRAQRALDAAGEHVLGKATECVPYDLGNLQKSATALPAQWHGDHIVKVIGFNTDYAGIVHETWVPSTLKKVLHTVTGKNGKTRRVTRTSGNKNSLARQKFLEMAMREQMPKINEMIANALRAGSVSDGNS